MADRRQSEARTAREGREQIRSVETVVEAIHMAPASVLAPGVAWYLRKARLALRQAERALAAADDPRLPALDPMRAQLRGPRPRLAPARRRHRCSQCFEERLIGVAEIELVGLRCYRCDAETMEPVRQLRRAK